MCGISGFSWEDKQLIREMTDCISHRGPDADGFYTDSNVSLGHRRLAIIDLSEKAKQPMTNEDHSIWITFNGEIYNFKELRTKLEKVGHRFSSDSDTEVLVHGWEVWGTKLPSMLNGDFAFALYDSKKKVIFLARDRLGIKPAYYYLKDGRLIFASEIKAILKHDVARKVNSSALKDFIALRYTPGEQTILENIKRIPPGHHLLFDLKTKKHRIARFWDIELGKTDLSEAEIVQQIKHMFTDSVERRLMSDVPLGVYLSGGIDSSAVVAAMSEIRKRGELDKIKTFSVGFGYGEATDELKHAKVVADHFDTDHTELMVKSKLVKELPKIIWHCDEPLADPALIPVYLMSREAKKHITVVLSGDGGDEVFAGYEQIKFMNTLNKLSSIPKPIRFAATAGARLVPKQIMNKFFKYSEALGKEGMNRLSRAVLADNAFDRYFEMVSIFDEKEQKELFNKNIHSHFKSRFNSTVGNGKDLNRLLMFEAKTLLPDNMLAKADKMTMAHAIEERVPFLDHRLVELMFNVPANLKMKGGSEKYLLKKAMHNTLPKEIIDRKKQRFYVPIDLWIQKEIRPLIESTLDKSFLNQYFNKEQVDKIFSNYSSSRLFYARQLWNLFTFHLWHKQFIEDVRPGAFL